MQTIPVWKVGVMVATTGAVTVGGWYVGAKAKHPWIGAAVGLFLVAPLANTPMAMSLTNDLIGSGALPQRATDNGLNAAAQTMGVAGTGPR